MSLEINVGNMENICSVCGRTLLTGERTEAYISAGGEERQVCDLCRARVERQGWARSDSKDQPTAPKAKKKKSRKQLRSIFRGPKQEEEGVDGAADGRPMDAAKQNSEDTDGHGVKKGRSVERATVREDPKRTTREATVGHRSVYAVPTSDYGKLERAIELFNKTEHLETVAGIARTLGRPHIATVMSDSLGSEVYLVVAWELSWYRYLVDVSKNKNAVRLIDRGDELDEIPEAYRSWNAGIDEGGRVGLLE